LLLYVRPTWLRNFLQQCVLVHSQMLSFLRRATSPYVRRSSNHKGGRRAAKWCALALGAVGVTAGACHHKSRPIPPKCLADVMREPLPTARRVQGKFVERVPFQRAVAECLAGHGVFVVWTPPGCGKTQCMREAADRWVAEGMAKGKARHVCWVSSYADPVVKTVSAQMRVRDTDDLQAQLYGTDYEVVVILDQFDDAFSHDDRWLQSNVVELAAASFGSKKFRVVIGVHSPVHAAEILSWNARAKMFLCGDVKTGNASKLVEFKWTAHEVGQLVRPEWTQEDRRAFITAGCQSGNIADMTRLQTEMHKDADRLQTQADLWTDGIRYLIVHARDAL
jgi:hypothetical protein